MEKQGVVKAGKTPSIKSGSKSDKVVKGEALSKDESSPKKTIEKTSELLDN